MIEYANTLTFVIPFRYDSDMRIRNLNVVLDDLSPLGAKAIVLEADTVPHYVLPDRHYHWVEYHFVEDSSALFYRTYYLNKLYRMVKTSIIGIWDTDILVPHSQIEKSLIVMCREKFRLSSPYDGRCFFMTECQSDSLSGVPSDEVAEDIQHNCFLPLGRPSVGGALLVDKDVYLASGGENEKFKGWGAEDTERIHRMDIMGYPLHRVEGCAYHLYHPRGMNSTFWDKEAQVTQQEEFFKICSMYPSELAHYIHAK